MQLIIKSEDGIFNIEGEFAIKAKEAFRTDFGEPGQVSPFSAFPRRRSVGFDVSMDSGHNERRIQTYETEQQAKNAIAMIYERLVQRDLAQPIFFEMPTQSEANLWM